MTGAHKVAVVGTGRLARALVRVLPDDVDVVVLARRPPELPLPRHSIAVVPWPWAAVDADVVIPAVPGDQVVAVLDQVSPLVEAGVVVFNVATDLSTAELVARYPRLRVVATKVVGQAGEIERGSLGAVAVDLADHEVFTLAQRLLAGIGPVVRLDEQRVLRVNTLVGEEMSRAAGRCRAALVPLQLPDVVLDAALATMAVGALRAIATGTAGPFLRRVLEREQNAT